METLPRPFLQRNSLSKWTPNPIIIQSSLIRIIFLMIILIRGKILQEHYHSKTAKWINSLSYNFLTIMMASSVVSRQRRSFLKILLWAKHTRGFLTNLLLGRKYFLCSNYTRGANNKINIRQFCEKSTTAVFCTTPESPSKHRDKCKWVGKKIKRKPLFSVLGPWVTCTSREHHQPNMQGTRRNSLKTGRNMVAIVANAMCAIGARQTWYLSKILHSQIFGLKVLFRKSA